MLIKRGRSDDRRGVASADGAGGQAVALQARMGTCAPCGLGVQLVTLEAAASGQSQALPLSETNTSSCYVTATVVLGRVDI